MVTDLSHQSRRALPRDWVASKVAVHEDCDLCQHVSVFEISALLWAFPPDTALHVSMGQSRIHEARSFSGLNVSQSQQDPSCLGPGMKVSCKQIFLCFIFLQNRLRLPSNTSLSCSFSRGVLTASVFVLHPDSLMMSGACLKSGSMSMYCPV